MTSIRMMAGDVVTPSVKLTRLLGQGGMGSVWVADHLGLQTEVAVKFVAKELADHPQMRARFTREASAAASIKSPHVVQVFDHGITTDGIPFIVMELLHGEALDKRLERLGGMPPEEVVTIVRHVAKALSKAHQAGVVHRDIKPANVFLVENDGDTFAKVLDFGIAKQKHAGEQGQSITQTGSMLGTPHYMSPEQMLFAKDADSQADLWALAVLAYECLTGHPPFQGETFAAVALAVTRCAFPRLAQERPELAMLDAWFERAFAETKDRRFGSARELAESFASAVTGSAMRGSDPELPKSDPWLASVPNIAAAPSSPDLGAATSAKATVGRPPAHGTTPSLGMAPTEPPPAHAAAPVPAAPKRPTGAIVAAALLVGGALVVGGIAWATKAGGSAGPVPPTGIVATQAPTVSSTSSPAPPAASLAPPVATTTATTSAHPTASAPTPALATKPDAVVKKRPEPVPSSKPPKAAPSVEIKDRGF